MRRTPASPLTYHAMRRTPASPLTYHALQLPPDAAALASFWLAHQASWSKADFDGSPYAQEGLAELLDSTWPAKSITAAACAPKAKAVTVAIDPDPPPPAVQLYVIGRRRCACGTAHTTYGVR